MSKEELLDKKYKRPVNLKTEIEFENKPMRDAFIKELLKDNIAWEFYVSEVSWDKAKPLTVSIYNGNWGSNLEYFGKILSELDGSKG